MHIAAHASEPSDDGEAVHREPLPRHIRVGNIVPPEGNVVLFSGHTVGDLGKN